MTMINHPLNILLHAIFFTTGISTVLIGQVLPILSKKLSLNDAEAANFFTAQFAGSLSGTFVYNFLMKRFGFITPILLGLVSITAGCITINSNTQTLCAIGFVLNGIGIGTTLPAINMIIAEANPLRTASALNLLNFFWGFGAILSQPFVSLLSAKSSILLPTSILAVIFLMFSSMLFAVRPRKLGIISDAAVSPNTNYVPIWKNPIAWLIAVFNFVHIGIESGLGGWLTTYSERFADDTPETVSATPVYFFLFVVGRLVAPKTIRLFNENSFILFGLSVLTVGISIMIFAQSYLLLLIGAAIAGFGTSAIFPTNMARFTKIFGETATRNATPIFIMGSLGSAFTTWFIGIISNYFDNLRLGFFVFLISSLILIVMQIAVSSVKKRNS